MALRDYLIRQNGGIPQLIDLTRNCENGLTNSGAGNRTLTKCSTCDVDFDCSIRISGSSPPPRCSKCSTTKSVYEMLCEPPRISQEQQAEVMHQHKKLRHHLLRENQRPSPSPSPTQPKIQVPQPSRSAPPTSIHQRPTPLPLTNARPTPLPLTNERPTPPRSTSPEEPQSTVLPQPPAADIIESLKKRRRSPSISHQGAIRIDDRHQRQLVATRDIAEGEIILQETPIIGAPMEKDFFVKKKLTPNGKEQAHLKFTSICLTCCRNVQTNYKCTKCGFPMCSLDCEKNSDHADFECEVFATNPVAPIVHTNEYKKIKVLRCLLLREKDPARWKKIMDLDPHDEVRSGNLCAVSTTIALCKFIQQECHLKQFDVETINRVVGVNTVHSLNTWNPSAYPITEVQNNEITKSTLIFYKAGLLAHDCKPNTRCIISQTGIGTENFMITVVASSAIPKGQVLSNCLVDVTRGTFQRRSELLESYYLACTCRRCMDPLEHCTFYSALKCPKCPNGQLLPGNPLSLDLSSVWLCNLAPRCDFIIVASQVMDLLRAVQMDVENAAVEHSLFQEYQNLQKVLAKYRGKILHKNHFYIMNIQYALIMVINQLLEIVNEDEALRLSHQQIALCRSCIDVVDILRPGNNRIRGNLLYFFHEGLLMTFLVEAKRRMSEPGSDFAITGRKQFEDILNIMRIGRECLILEPPGSPENNRALKLSIDSSGLQPLMRYFNIRTYDPLPKTTIN